MSFETDFVTKRCEASLALVQQQQEWNLLSLQIFNEANRFSFPACLGMRIKFCFWLLLFMTRLCKEVETLLKC